MAHKLVTTSSTSEEEMAHVLISSTQRLNIIKLMIKAGIVVQLENPQNRRRPLHVLAPGIKVTIEGENTVIDFDFVAARLSAGGN